MQLKPLSWSVKCNPETLQPALRLCGILSEREGRRVTYAEAIAYAVQQTLERCKDDGAKKPM